MEEIKEIDYLVFGEGEMSMVELVESIESKRNIKTVDGVIFRQGKKIFKNKARGLIKDLNTLHFSDRSLINLNLYDRQHVTRGISRKEKKVVEIMTSRGCPNRCIFCAGHVNYGMSVRFRSFENVAREIMECMQKYGVKHISIEDDTFTLNKKLVREMCAFFKKKKLTWNCNARVNTVDYDLLKAMAKSGCKKIVFGVESGNPEIMRKNKKGITIPQVIKAVREAKRAKIRFVECDFIIGSHIDETVEDFQDTIRLIYKLMPDFLSVSIMCPYPGTEIYEMMIGKGYLEKKPNWDQFTVFGDLERYSRLTYLTPKQMVEMQRKILKEYYSSKKYILSQLIQIRTLFEVKYFLNLGVAFLKEFIFKRR
jgi:radical SAM superfamily enzyme YgiQ (UPF0313 family)